MTTPKFKNGDKVRTLTMDTWGNRDGVVDRVDFVAGVRKVSYRVGVEHEKSAGGVATKWFWEDELAHYEEVFDTAESCAIPEPDPKLQALSWEELQGLKQDVEAEMERRRVEANSEC